MNFARKIVETSDGSKTIELEGLNEHYHSIHGAFQESMHVFIKNGLQFQLEKGMNNLRVLEIGFGSGLNFLTTLNYLLHKDKKLEYIGLEAFPLYADVLFDLAYEQRFDKHSISLCHRMLLYPNEMHVSESFGVKAKQLIDYVSSVKLTNAYFDLIYFDAFAPRVQPEMWSMEVMRNMFEALAVGGCLVTYCAKGEVKRTLSGVGFKVESLPGPPGKREMTRALKC